MRRTLVWPVAGLLCAGAAVAAASGGGAADDAIFGADGLRISHYRAPTPQRVPHGTTVDAGELRALMESADPVLIDVQAVVVRPDLEEFGMTWLPGEPRRHLPGSTWLPNVGYGRLEPRMERYFRDNLARLTGGDNGRAIVFYCVVDCWMSWNAVQRAAAYGYTRLYWFRGGTDEWADRDLPMVDAVPQPIGTP